MIEPNRASGIEPDRNQRQLPEITEIKRAIPELSRGGTSLGTAIAIFAVPEEHPIEANVLITDNIGSILRMVFLTEKLLFLVSRSYA